MSSLDFQYSGLNGSLIYYCQADSLLSILSTLSLPLPSSFFPCEFLLSVSMAQTEGKEGAEEEASVSAAIEPYSPVHEIDVEKVLSLVVFIIFCGLKDWARS